GSRTSFDLPLHAEGTPFMRRVWEELCGIPYGETRSYKEIAVAIGRPGAMRAVGMANSRNPIALIIPCHRVIGADGSLTGFASGVDLKRRLLELEAGGAPLPL
ncbi:MAG: methylated-DNA--[protein]-cysteine S-methyltransferase, partial [Deltaproteobacteria bacterium]|nr:methylated-DNA--[protein]-cysteine S-methyltransferase [Deltaproteobacteria bacterium]